MQQVYSQSPHFLPLISAMTSDTDENFTRSLERMCVSHLAQACSFIDVATKNKNDTCCALCPGYQEQTFSSNSSRLPVRTYWGTYSQNEGNLARFISNYNSPNVNTSYHIATIFTYSRLTSTAKRVLFQTVRQQGPPNHVLFKKQTRPCHS